MKTYITTINLQWENIEVVLARIKIGHTNLTYGYLMKTPHDPIPICNVCQTTVKVKHIICECTKFDRQRIAIIDNKSLKEVLSESQSFSIYPLIKFLKTCNLLNKI